MPRATGHPRVPAERRRREEGEETSHTRRRPDVRQALAEFPGGAREGIGVSRRVAGVQEESRGADDGRVPRLQGGGDSGAKGKKGLGGGKGTAGVGGGPGI